jgi:hypothetical protein
MRVSAPTASEAALAGEAASRFPGFTATGVLHRSATSVLLGGDVWGEPAVAKLLTSSSPFWRETMSREIGTYRLFAQHPPPFRAPRLLDADERTLGLVLEFVDGEQLSDQRTPDREIPPHRLAAVFTALQRLGEWRPPVHQLAQPLDYPSRFDRHRRSGYLSAGEHGLLSELLTAAGEPADFCHGDLVTTHILRRTAGEGGYKEGDYAFVDWAFAGAFLPGFDLAKLWAVLGATFGARSEIADQVRARGDERWRAFLINLAVLVLQDLRTHREAPEAPQRNERLAALEADWRQVRDWLAATR